MARCYNCGTTLEIQGTVGRSLECPGCNRPVRCCRNCTFYQPGAHWDCHESIPEPVHDKERSNFCDYFRLNNEASGASGTGGSSDSSRRDFDALFS